jgi:hypothetical protein
MRALELEAGEEECPLAQSVEEAVEDIVSEGGIR